MLICARSPYVLVRVDNPTIRIPRPCGTYKCPCCRPAKVNERVRVAAWGLSFHESIRHITLTRVPSNWQHARMQIRDLVRRIRKSYKLEWAWAIEENPRKTGYHAHAMQWGEYIPKHRLQTMWGERITYIRRVGEGAEGYLAKCAAVAGYLSKDIGQHLAINGGRAIHMTRGFLGGWTSREVLQEMSSGHRWRLEHATPEELADTFTRKWEDKSTLTFSETDQ